MIRFRTLGGLDLRADAGDELRPLLAQPKRVALLVYLAIEATNGFCRRDQLLALFWPEFDTDRARLALRQALHFLRRSLGAETLISRGDEEIRMAPDVLWCDAVALQNAIDQGRAQEALELYHGDLLPGFFISDASPDFDQWLEDQRQRLRFMAAGAAWKLADAAERDGNAIEAVLRGRDAVRLAPDDEAGVRRLIGLLDRLGDRAGALRTYDAFVERLRQAFDLEPAAETRALVEAVRARTDAGAVVTARRTPHSDLTVDAASNAESSSTTSTHPRTRRVRRALVSSGVAAAVLIGVALLVFPLKSNDPLPLLAVGWIDNQAGSASDETARLIPGLLATTLSRVPDLAVVSEARLYEVLSHLNGKAENAQVITEAARRAGAHELLQGVLYRRNDRLRLDLRRIDLESGVLRESYTAQGVDAFELTDSLTAAVARAFALAAPPSARAEGSTRSLAARRLYEEGLREYFGGESRVAHDLFAAALKEDSTFAMAAFYAGVSRSYYDAPGAQPYLVQSLRHADRAPERDRLLIKLGTQGSDYALSTAVAETLATRFPAEPDGHLALAIRRSSAGDFLNALPHARRVLAIDSLNLSNKSVCRACDAYALIVDSYMRADSFAAAESTARAWIRQWPASPTAWEVLSNVLRYAGRTDSAVAAFHTAEKLRPTPGAVYNQAVIAMHNDDFAEANRLLNARLKYDATDARAMWYLAISLRNQGRVTQALAWAQRARTVSTGVEPMLAQGQALFELGRFREAAAQFDSVAHYFAPGGPLLTAGWTARHLSWTHTHTATALAAAGDTVAVKSLVDSIAAIAHLSAYGRDWRLPDHVRGLVWLARGQPEQALQSLRAAIHSPTLGYTRTNLELAHTLLALNRPGEAVAILQSALRGPIEASNFYVTRTELQELLARSFQLANQRDSAAAYYRKVIAAWSNGDPPFQARADSARRRLAVLSPSQRS